MAVRHLSLFLCGLIAAPVMAQGALERSPRPQARASAEALPVVRAALVVEPARVLRPMLRPEGRATPEVVPVQASAQDAGLQRWIAGFRGRALNQGISAGVFDAAFRGVRYDPDVIKRDRNQAEFKKEIWDYLDVAVSQERLQKGAAAMRRHGRTLQQIESHYGVDRHIVAAVWGLESKYGENRGDLPIIQSLATLAYDGRRGAFFEKQLVAALKILQRGDTTPRNMTGSWAGAMGHTQFIPTSYQAYAVDATGDGKRDIWSDNPADALASTAAYLKQHGWVTGMPPLVEVRLPAGFNSGNASRKITRMPSDWARMGVTDVRGRPVRDYGSASILLPAGTRGAAFMIFKNFRVIERYNAADAYVIGVSQLGAQLAGGLPIQASWPRDPNSLNFEERKELQALLTRRGFDTGGVDGAIGANSIAAIIGFQRSAGLPQDGAPTKALLQRLRR